MRMISGERLYLLRSREGYTQAFLAEELGVEHTRISYIENETRGTGIPMLIKLADYFGVTTDYLLGRD